jgi:hypothetical protein
MRPALLALLVALSLPSGASAKTCSGSYTHAVIGGSQKCLRAGEYCARAEKRQYTRYGFSCVVVGGTYRLERR